MTISEKMKKISYWITLRRNDVNVMDLLACMSLAGTIPVVLCFLLYLLQRGSYNYQFGRKLLLTGGGLFPDSVSVGQVSDPGRYISGTDVQ